MTMNNTIQSLLAFLDASPVSFLAVAAMEERLAAAGFRRLDPADPMPALAAGDAFYVTKNDSSLYAFRLGRRALADAGFRLICAHCDSPTFRIKPNPEMRRAGVVQLNVEAYGGAILSTWFDRPLSLAGRVLLRTADPLRPATRLLHVRRPLLQIPNLAIHFNRQVNDGVRLSRQKDMIPVLALDGAADDGQLAEAATRAALPPSVLLGLIAAELGVPAADVLDFDLYLYDTTPACLWGLHGEFISAGRLDDLSMVHAGLEALVAAPAADVTQVLAVFDNEETGSATKQGAASPFLRSLLERLVAMQMAHLVADGLQPPTALAQTAAFLVADGLHRAVERAFMISADNAHALHPNYVEKYDPTNQPTVGDGPVVKYNAAQKYASDADSAAVFRALCQRAGVPCQTFVNHGDVAGGSTLGNILTASLPLRGVDMGAPIWAMHSCRESGAVSDHLATIRVFTEFYGLEA